MKEPPKTPQKSDAETAEWARAELEQDMRRAKKPRASLYR